MSLKLHSQVDELEINLNKCLHIENAHESDGDDISDVEEGFEELEPNPNHKHVYKAATFPRPGKVLSSSASSDEEDDEEVEIASQQIFSDDPMHLPGSHSASLLSPLKSAMKGSREKQGASPKILTVSWAPDVYDPIPNSLSHAVKGKQKKQPKNNDNYKKTKGKKGQKGNFSKGGGGGSSKKQFRKIGGSSDRCYKTLDARERVVDPYDDLDDFGVGSPDPYCGSSFLKKSSNKMHYAIAEAL